MAQDNLPEFDELSQRDDDFVKPTGSEGVADDAGMDEDELEEDELEDDEEEQDEPAP